MFFIKLFCRFEGLHNVGRNKIKSELFMVTMTGFDISVVTLEA